MTFLRFCIVGAIGFVIDSGLLFLLVSSFGLYFSRMMSFSSSLMITWFLNSNFTFKVQKKNTFHKYLFSSLLGGAVNYSTYVFFAKFLGLANGVELLISVALGSASGLIFNFLINKFIVFNDNS